MEKYRFSSPDGFVTSLQNGINDGENDVLDMMEALAWDARDALENAITLGSYMSMFFSMVLLIGIAFEFPTVVMVLGRLGIVSRELLRKGRKYAFVLVLILAALITPADPFSMFVLAIPLYLLYELSILLCSKSEEKPEAGGSPA